LRDETSLHLFFLINEYHRPSADVENLGIPRKFDRGNFQTLLEGTHFFPPPNFLHLPSSAISFLNPPPPLSGSAFTYFISRLLSMFPRRSLPPSLRPGPPYPPIDVFFSRSPCSDIWLFSRQLLIRKISNLSLHFPRPP